MLTNIYCFFHKHMALFSKAAPALRFEVVREGWQWHFALAGEQLLPVSVTRPVQKTRETTLYSSWFGNPDLNQPLANKNQGILEGRIDSCGFSKSNLMIKRLNKYFNYLFLISLMNTSYSGLGDLHEVEFAIPLSKNVWEELSQWHCWYGIILHCQLCLICQLII